MKAVTKLIKDAPISLVHSTVIKSNEKRNIESKGNVNENVKE